MLRASNIAPRQLRYLQRLFEIRIEPRKQRELSTTTCLEFKSFLFGFLILQCSSRHECYTHGKESSAAIVSTDLRDKLATLVDRNKKVKLEYHQLQSQITFGLLEAGEVFDSLAIPLMKLVGLKTSEMESEGRHSTFIFNTERYHMDTAKNGARSDDLDNRIRSSKVTNQVFRYAKKSGASYINKPKMRHYVHCYALHCLDEEASNALRRAFKERGENVGSWRQACYKPLVDIACRHGWDIDAVFNAHPRLSIWYVPTMLRQLCHLERNNAVAAAAALVGGISCTGSSASGRGGCGGEELRF